MEKIETGKQKSPYYLVIHTDSYSGNFSRELIGFSFGILTGSNNHSFRKYIEAFWNSECASDVDSLEEYKELNNTVIKKIKKESEENLFKKLIEKKGLSEEEARERVLNFKLKRDKKDYENSLERIYDKYLCYTNQWVDDWEEETFYNITFFGDDKNFYNSVYVQLNEPLSDNFEEIIINRIKKFFELDIYNVFKNYEYLCEFLDSYDIKEKIILLDLELIDSNGNLIKKYDI